MPCLTQQAGQGDLGLGTQLYLDTSACTSVADPDADPPLPDSGNTYTKMPCVQNVTPPGKTWNTITDDGCLDINEQNEQLSASVLNDVVTTIRYTPFDATDIALRAARDNRTIMSTVIRHPVGTGYRYEWFDSQVKEYTPQQISKTEFRTSSLTFLVRTESYWTDDNTDLGSGFDAE